MEIVFFKNGKEVDSVDPYYSHEESESYVIVEGGAGHHVIEKKNFDNFEVMPMRKRPLE